jgi:hypothetical protein
LADKPYGKSLLKSLPAMTRTRSLDRARMFLMPVVEAADVVDALIVSEAAATS